MKIIEKENSNTTFGEIKFGECFKIKNTDIYFMRTSLILNPSTDGDFNSVNLSTGCFDYFIDAQKVVKVDCELVIK